MTESELHALADDRSIRIVDNQPLPATGSMIIETPQGYAIGIDKGLSRNEKRAHLAHELGHAMKGAVYRASSPLRTRSRCEYRANKWMYEHILPLSILETTCRENLQASMFELSEILDVPEDVLRAAIRHYAMQGMLIKTFSRCTEPPKDKELSLLMTHVMGKMILDA